MTTIPLLSGPYDPSLVRSTLNALIVAINAMQSGGASAGFANITGGTNTSAAMVVGTGASLSAANSGVIAATSVPASALTGNLTSAQLAAYLSDETGTGLAVFSASPAFSGTPTVPTAAPGTSSTQAASTAFAAIVAASAAAAANAGMSADVASTTNIAGTYVSVGSGIGDTYTTTATGALTIDGQSITLGLLVLMKNLTGGPNVGAYNGLYTVTVAGTTGVSTVFTRATDYDQASDINNTGPIAVKTGTTNAGTSYILTTKVVNVGTDALTYTIFTPAYAQIAQIGTVNAFSAQQYAAQQSLTDASPITWNLNTQQAAAVLLTSAIGATRQLQNPTNQQAGASYTLKVTQSSTGSNVLTFGTSYKWPGGTAPTLSTANNAIDILTFISDGTNMYGVSQLAFA